MTGFVQGTSAVAEQTVRREQLVSSAPVPERVARA